MNAVCHGDNSTHCSYDESFSKFMDLDDLGSIINVLHPLSMGPICKRARPICQLSVSSLTNHNGQTDRAGYILYTLVLYLGTRET
jgi:hypothetical protein